MTNFGSPIRFENVYIVTYFRFSSTSITQGVLSWCGGKESSARPSPRYLRNVDGERSYNFVCAKPLLGGAQFQRMNSASNTCNTAHVHLFLFFKNMLVKQILKLLVSMVDAKLHAKQPPGMEIKMNNEETKPNVTIAVIVL